MKCAVREIILLNDHAFVSGGAAAVALAEARGFARRGFAVTLFAGVGPAEAGLADEPNLRVVCLGLPDIASNPRRTQAWREGLRNGRAVWALERLLDGKSPVDTVVHAHSWTKSLSPFVIAAAARRGFPVVVTLHDYFLACPNGGFFVHPKGEPCGRRPMSRSCWLCRCDRRNYAHKLWRGVRTWLQNGPLGVPRRVSAYVGVSESSLRRLRPYLPDRTPAGVVRNPVDAPDEGPAPVAANRSFAFVGRLEPEKGARLFAEAARAAGVPAAFVGDGALRAELGARYPEARFTGWLDEARVRRELRTARALVFPPLWHETLGLVVIQAAAAGVPAIVPQGSAVSEHIRDDANGIHFARGSASALGAALRSLAGDDARAARLGRAAYEWYWRNPWTTERHVSELLEIYESAGRLGARH